MSVVDFAVVLCSSTFAASLAGVAFVSLLFAASASALFHLRACAAECSAAHDRAALAERALSTQAECHSRDACRTRQEIADLAAAVDETSELMYTTRRRMRELKAQGETLLAANGTAASRMGELGAEVDELASTLQEQEASTSAETTNIRAAEIAARGAIVELRSHVADEKWRCERQVQLAATRADETIRHAMASLDANVLERSATKQDGAPPKATVDCERARLAVAVHARHQHLTRTSKAVCAEVERVWGVEVARLQQRAKANAKALDALNAEASKLDERDGLVEAWSEVNQRTAAVVTEAEGVEDAVWEQSAAL